MAILMLPDSKDEMDSVIERMVNGGMKLRNIQKIEWMRNHYYMQGARNFSGIDYLTGSMDVNFENIYGQIDYRYEQVVRRANDELGRRLRIDLNPVATKEHDFSLEGLRRCAMANVVLSNIVADLSIEQIKKSAIEMMLRFGTVGIAAWGQRNLGPGKVTRPILEIVPPWELLSVPSDPATPEAVMGIIRYRWVPVKWLKKQDKLGKFQTGGKDGVRVIEVPYGDDPEKYGVDSGGSASSNTGVVSKKDSSNVPIVEYTDLAELFVPEKDGTLRQYVVWAGGKTLHVGNFEDTESAKRPMMPIGIARDLSMGGFYGRSFCSLLIPTNIEVEYMLKNLFENMQDLDAFGYLTLPLDMGINESQLRQGGKPRILWYQPDPTLPEHRPGAIQPVNLGELPARVAAVGKEIIDDLSGQSAMMRQGDAPGRVDSAGALGMLMEESAVPLGGPMLSLAEAFLTAYRALLGMAKEEWPEGHLARITSIDDTIMGVVIDSETGRLKLEPNSVPHPTEVELKVRSQIPTSKNQRKAELLQMLQLGLVTPRELRRINWIEDLGLPLGNRAELENWRRATFQNIVMFGDGKTPGEVPFSPESDIPEIQLEAISTFMAKPEFHLAAGAVKDAFEERKGMYEEELGKRYPSQMALPEEEAMQQAQQQESQQNEQLLPR